MKATRRRAPGGVTILHTAIFSDVMHRNFNKKHNSTLKRKLRAWVQNSGGTKLDNGFTELINYAITHRYPTLEFLSTTGCTRFVEDMIRKYEHFIQWMIQNTETHDFWDLHRNNVNS